MIVRTKKAIQREQSGFVIILSVIILAAIGVAISVSLLLLSVGITQTSGSLQDSQQAKGIANACAELALQKLVTSSAFLGTVNISLGQGTCSYTIAQLTTLTDTIKVTGTVNATVRKVQIQISIPSLYIAYWQEVGDFN